MKTPSIIKRLKKDESGATAVEAAIVFPLLFVCLVGVMGFGTFMFETHKAQRTVEETARMARVINSPSHDDLLKLLSSNLDGAMIGTFEPIVVMLDQFDGNYAEIKVNYRFKFDIPFANNLDIASVATTQVKLRDVPT